uniref:NADH:ubiquinone oxidoreductase intermediate-associated protein 30 domain-containing protein n=1 Tax=Aureoumbra lagunensis TaxID=44058 RepID=A0A7S3NGL9_9STRA|mmetsp:Transcript_3331/g.4628  ORF Transcript_3331/g.4628 Transcript_3331/m.4628 type:complete len:221 (+) Transcript_3331:116-778(+)
MNSLKIFVLLVVVESFEFGKFLKTSVFFNPLLSGTSKVGGSQMRGNKAAEIFPNSNIIWGPLDDTVMGGRSDSSWVTLDDGSGMWSGTVTTAGGGGFAGTRCKVITPPLDLSAYTGIKIKVRNDKGLRFKFVIRDNSDWNGPAWTWMFNTLPNNSITEVKLPFDRAVPTVFARTLSGQTLNKKTITTLQFVFSKFEFDDALNPTFVEGPFSLKIESISVY